MSSWKLVVVLPRHREWEDDQSDIEEMLGVASAVKLDDHDVLLTFYYADKEDAEDAADMLQEEFEQLELFIKEIWDGSQAPNRMMNAGRRRRRSLGCGGASPVFLNVIKPRVKINRPRATALISSRASRSLLRARDYTARITKSFAVVYSTSKPAQSYVSRKIKKLLSEGYPQKQAVAIALSMARREGYKV